MGWQLARDAPGCRPTCRQALSRCLHLQLPGIWPRICRDAVPKSRPPLHPHHSSHATGAQGDEPVLCLRSSSCCVPPSSESRVRAKLPPVAPVGRWSTRAVEASKFALSDMQEAQALCGMQLEAAASARRFAVPAGQAPRAAHHAARSRCVWQDVRGGMPTRQSMRHWPVLHGWSAAWLTAHPNSDAGWMDRGSVQGQASAGLGCSRGSTGVPRIPQP